MVRVKELPLHLAPDVLCVQPPTFADKLSACKHTDAIPNSNAGIHTATEVGRECQHSHVCLPWHALSSCQLIQGAPEVDTPLQTACYTLSLHVFCTKMQVSESLQTQKDEHRCTEM